MLRRIVILRTVVSHGMLKCKECESNRGRAKQLFLLYGYIILAHFNRTRALLPFPTECLLGGVVFLTRYYGSLCIFRFPPTITKN